MIIPSISINLNWFLSSQADNCHLYSNDYRLSPFFPFCSSSSEPILCACGTQYILSMFFRDTAPAPWSNHSLLDIIEYLFYNTIVESFAISHCLVNLYFNNWKDENEGCFLVLMSLLTPCRGIIRILPSRYLHIECKITQNSESCSNDLPVENGSSCQLHFLPP